MENIYRSDDYINKIERFLDGDMSPKEYTIFEQEIETQAELKEELELHRLAREAIELAAWKTKAKDIFEERQEKGNIGKIVVGLLAGLTLLFIAFEAYKNYNKTDPKIANNDEIAEEIITPSSIDSTITAPAKDTVTTETDTIVKQTETTPTTPKPRSKTDTIPPNSKNYAVIASAFYTRPELQGGLLGQDETDTLDSLFQQANTAYQKQDCGSATVIYDSIVEQASNDYPDLQSIYLFKGICAYEQNNLKQALDTWGKISTGSNFRESQWFKALAYLRLDEMDSCIAELKQILATRRHVRKIEAQNLLDELNE